MIRNVPNTNSEKVYNDLRAKSEYLERERIRAEEQEYRERERERRRRENEEEAERRRRDDEMIQNIMMTTWFSTID